MSPQTITAITNALTPLASKIGEAGAYLFQLAVRQAYIDGFECLVLGLLLIGFSIPVITFMYKKVTVKVKKGTYSWNQNTLIPEWDETGWVLIFIISLICWGGGLFLLENAVNALANPQYYAIQSLISQFNPN